MKHFVEFLQEKALVKPEALIAAMAEQASRQPSVLEVVAKNRLLPEDQILAAVVAQSREQGGFIEACRKLDIWNDELAQSVRRLSETTSVPLTQLLLERGLIDRPALNRAVDDYLASMPATAANPAKADPVPSAFAPAPVAAPMQNVASVASALVVPPMTQGELDQAMPDSLKEEILSMANAIGPDGMIPTAELTRQALVELAASMQGVREVAAAAKLNRMETLAQQGEKAIACAIAAKDESIIADAGRVAAVLKKVIPLIWRLKLPPLSERADGPEVRALGDALGEELAFLVSETLKGVAA